MEGDLEGHLIQRAEPKMLEKPQCGKLTTNEGLGNGLTTFADSEDIVLVLNSFLESVPSRVRDEVVFKRRSESLFVCSSLSCSISCF